MNLYTSSSLEYQRFESMKDNIFKTFGTRSFFEMLLPSMRDLPFFGHEWTLEVLDLEDEESTLLKTGNFISS